MSPRLPTQTLMGSTRQEQVQTVTERRPDLARYAEVSTAYASTREQGEAVY